MDTLYIILDVAGSVGGILFLCHYLRMAFAELRDRPHRRLIAASTRPLPRERK
jgi:hypothetical protein